jgi:hypothetical protein
MYLSSMYKCMYSLYINLIATGRSATYPNIYLIILEGKAIVPRHKTIPQKTGTGELRPLARDKEVTPGVQQHFLHFFGDFF